ncbi:unnamed protein product [Closterium sp. Yama58-4]|nr:unnamed protein product [Closterium sp. Yama58-4]
MEVSPRRRSPSRRELGEGGAAKDELFIAVVAGVLLLLTLVVLIAIFLWKPSGKGGKAGKAGMWAKGVDTPKGSAVIRLGSQKYNMSSTEDVAVPSLPLNDLQVATNGFSEESAVGDVGYSTVYRGEGPNGEAWAVKRAKRVSLEGSHLFRNEVDFLSQVNHENIVTLLASCDENNEQILVFEFLPNGPLSTWLRPPPGDERAPLSFEQRLDIALGVAEALRYLHSFTKPTIIHRDVKSDTILLDQSFKVKVGGLGLLKHLPGEAMRLRMARKKGYLDPEYFQTFKVTTKCDVYSFGVVMLEMLTGQPPIVQNPSRLPPSPPTPATPNSPGAAPEPPCPAPPMTLPQWALPLIHEGKLDELVDPRLPADYPRDSLLSLARIAAACVAPLRKDRPDMPKVTFLLAELKRPAASRSVAFARFNAAGHKVVPTGMAQ